MHGRDEKMTQLLNNKKVAQDSLTFAHTYEIYYDYLAKEQKSKGADSNIWHKYVDTASVYYAQQWRLNKKIMAMDVLIDSLDRVSRIP